jgi:predicted nucleotidyltransferase
MVMSDEILKIRDAIVNAVPTEKIYLFGSYAYGTPDADSDYDLYVVIPDGGMRPVEAIQSIYRSMRGTKRKPPDIPAGTAETFERRSKQLTPERTIAEEGGCAVCQILKLLHGIALRGWISRRPARRTSTRVRNRLKSSVTTRSNAPRKC